jgi:F0F1-type ATP synthase assembly protein I
MHEPSPGKPKPKLFRVEDVLRLTGFGFYFASCLLLGTLGGIWLDGKFGTRPWLLLAGLALGSVAGFYGMFSMLRPYLARNGRSGRPGTKQ